MHSGVELLIQWASGTLLAVVERKIVMLGMINAEWVCWLDSFS